MINMIKLDREIAEMYEIDEDKLEAVQIRSTKMANSLKNKEY